MPNVIITIGIPTYNEEANIVDFFKELISQIGLLDYKFEIIIVDDSEDKTMDLLDKTVKSNPKITFQVIHNQRRMGATHAWNTIFRLANGEIIVLLDADIGLGIDCIKNLINSISHNIGLCASNTLPKTMVKTRYARAASFIAYWLTSVRLLGLSQYTTMGRALSISGKLCKSIEIPENIIAIDLYLQCLVIQEGKLVTFNKDAIIYFKPPSTKSDFYSQIVRAIKGHSQISQYVKEFKFDVSIKNMFIEFFKTAFDHPRDAIDLIICYLFLPYYYHKNSKKVTYLWDLAGSTK